MIEGVGHMPKAASQLAMGDFNQVLVLDLIRRANGQVSRIDLGDRSGLAPQTVSNIVGRLLDSGLVTEGAAVPRGRGKPPRPLTVNPAGACAVGVHLDPATVSYTLLDLAGGVAGRLRRRTPPGTKPADIVAQVVETVADLTGSCGADPDRLLGIGLAVPGPIDDSRGVLLTPPQLSQWHDVPLRDDLAAAAGVPVLMEKDVNAAAVAEVWAREGCHEDFVLLYLGTGVATGLVLGGEVWRGRSGNSGEIGGVLTTDGSGAPLRFADRVIPGDLICQARELGVDVPEVDPDDPVAVDEAFTRLVLLAADGDPAAGRVLDESVTAAGAVLAQLINLVDVDHVVVGGPLWSRVSDRYLADLASTMRPRLVDRDDVRVLPSVQGDTVTAYGAAALVMNRFLAPRPGSLIGA
ncbi:ROK family transcriptional regulator [Naumannella huperziae]